jgi:hypothetical protein
MDQEKNIDLVIRWFEHIAQLADDRKTVNGFVMDYQDAMDEIRALALRSRDYVKMFMKKS